MKKIVVLLLVLAIVAGQALFAQEEGLKVTGAVKTGFQFTGGKDTIKDGDDVDRDGVYKLNNDDAGAASRTDLTFAYTTANAGATATFRADLVQATTDISTLSNALNNAQVVDPADTSKTTTLFPKNQQIPDSFGSGYSLAVGLANAYGWYGFLDGIIELSAGYLDNGKWGTLDGFNIDNTLDNANLVKLEVKPIDGLSLGINTLYLNAGHPYDEFREYNALANTVYGAKYKTDAFGAAIEFVGYNTDYSGIWTANGGWYGNSDIAKYASAFGTLFSAYFYGVDNLKVDLDGYAASWTEGTLGKKIKAGTFGLAVQGLYTIDALEAGLKAAFGTANKTVDDNGNGAWDLVLTPKASYKVTEVITAGVEIPLGFVDNKTLIGDEEKAQKVDKWHGAFTFGIKPKATFDFGNGAKLVTWYLLGTKKEAYYDELGKGEKESSVDHTLQVDFIWSF